MTIIPMACIAIPFYYGALGGFIGFISGGQVGIGTPSPYVGCVY